VEILALPPPASRWENAAVSPASLPERLRARIAREGPLGFDAFQQASLYDPDGGYYERPGRVGRGGDFVTGASWHPAFARCLARVASRLAEVLPRPVDVVDVGAGEGELLAHLHGERPGDLGVRLTGVEASGMRRSLAATRVPGARFVASVDELPVGLSGLVVAYELFDALPVRALRALEDGSLAERKVTVDEAGRFAWVDAPCPDAPELLAALARRGAALEPGQLLEIRPGAAGLARSLGARLDAGLLLLFDYGAPTRALYGPARANGTLEAFVEHRVTRDVLAEPGSRDITAWVDFGEIEEVLRGEGLTVHGLVSQSRLLLAAGIVEELRVLPGERVSPEKAVERNAVAKLVSPGGMGESIRVLVAERKTGLGKSFISSPLV
jgi:SAM-dependent MidA family methyltransferase